MKDYNDNKICLYEKPYLTINGEAQWIGTPSVFVRFQGCSVGCTWCDAMSTWPDPKSGKGLWMSNKQLTEYIDEQFPNCSRIWITGGEPTEHSKKYGVSLSTTESGELRKESST